MVTIFMTIFLIINVVITVYNWDDEVDFIKITMKDVKNAPYVPKITGFWNIINPIKHIKRYITMIKLWSSWNKQVYIAITLFALDFIVTGASATLFGIGVGVVGSAVTLFMSNLLSSVFLIPKDSDMQRVKSYQRAKGKRRWIWFKV